MARQARPAGPLLPPGCGWLPRLLREAAALEEAGCDCALLSGGLDTSFALHAHPRPGRVAALTVAFPGSTDLPYAVEAAGALGAGRHVVLRPGPRELLEAARWVVGRLRTLDPVEVSADAVHYIALRAAKRMGCGCVASGDGGDELLLGYTFLLRAGERRLWEWRLRMSERAWLPTAWVGRQLGLEVGLPLYTREARRAAPLAPLRCLIDRWRGLGKLPLRAELMTRGLPRLALRPKAPVTTGSGSRAMLERIARERPPGQGEVERAARLLGYRPVTPLERLLAVLFLESGAEPPPPCPDPERRCPRCGRCLEAGYCRFCGYYAGATSGGGTS